MESGEWRIGVSPSSLLELLSLLLELLLDDDNVLELLPVLLLDNTALELLDAATTSKLPQDMAGLRVTLVVPHITSPKVMVLVPVL